METEGDVDHRRLPERLGQPPPAHVEPQLPGRPDRRQPRGYPLGADGRVNFANYVGSTHLIADVAGWFSNVNLPTPAA